MRPLPRFRSAGPLLAAALLAAAIHSPTSADAAIVGGTLNFQGPQNTFGITLNLSSTTNTIRVANLNGRVEQRTDLGFLGCSTIGCNFSAPTQTFNITIASPALPVTINSSPIGTMPITYDNQTAEALTIGDSTFINITGSTTQNVVFNTVTAQVDLDCVFGLDVQLRIFANATIRNVTFTATAEGSVDGVNPGFAQVPGDIGGLVDLSATAEAEVIGITIGLGNIINTTLGLSETLGFGGLYYGEDMQRENPTYPHDFRNQIFIDASSLGAINLPLNLTETIDDNNMLSGCNSGIQRIHADVTVTSGFNLSNIAVNVESTLPDVIIAPPAEDTYRFWDGNEDFSTGGGTATGLGTDAAWTYGTGSGGAIVAFNQTYNPSFLGSGNPGWRPSGGSPPAVARALTTVAAPFNVPSGNVAIQSVSGTTPIVTQWLAPAGVSQVFVSGVVWDANPANNRPQAVTVQRVNSGGTIVENLFSGLVNAQNTAARPMGFIHNPDLPFFGYDPIVDLNPGDRIQFLIQPNGGGAGDEVGAHFYVQNADPQPTPTPTPSPSANPTATPTVSSTPTPTPSPYPSPTASPNPTPSPDPTATPSPDPSATPSPSADPTATPSPDPSATPSPSADATATPSPDPSATPSADATATPSPDPSATPSADATATPSPDPSATPSADATATPSPDPSATPSPDASATPTAGPCCPGDANNSGSFVDAADFIAVQANFGADNGIGGLGDANCSGSFVDAADFIAVQANFGSDCG